MAFWKRNEPLQVGSSFYTIDIATGKIDRDKSPIPLNAVFDRNPFLRELPQELRASFQEVVHGTSREYRRQTDLRGGTPGSTTMHIVLRGCVAERTRIGSSSTIRIHGAGAVLGCMEVFDERMPPPTATCLTDTWTMSVSLERMRTLALSHASLMRAIGISVTDRLEATERIYNRHGLKPVQRLAGLLAHLVMHCAVPADKADFRIEGPSQSDLAEALSLSIGSVEAALATLRFEDTVITGYRTYEFPSLRRLLATSAIQFPPESLAGALAAF